MQPASGKLSCGPVVSLTNDDPQDDVDQHEEMSPDSLIRQIIIVVLSQHAKELLQNRITLIGIWLLEIMFLNWKNNQVLT